MDIERVQQLIEEYKDTFLPSDWKWRTYQRETIESIIMAYLNKTASYVVCECPTGSGKSHIALCVSYVLNKIKKRGFILTSDVSLQNQYEADMLQHIIPWGSVKGVDRYKCTDNNEPCSIGTCRIRRKNPRDLDCYSTCPYFSARDKASETNTSILNYSYWLVQMNERQDPEDGAVYFPKRDFVICDEAHKITDIVQSHFAPRLSLESLDRFTEICEFLDNYNILNDYNPSFDKIKLLYKAIFKYDEIDSIYGLLSAIVTEMQSIVKCSEMVIDKSK
ncbi:MAG: DEAD/DEAH box helicase family protein, partial [Sarcina sp.]